MSERRVPLEHRLALSVSDAAALLGISRSKAYQLVADGTLPAVTIGKVARIPRRALEAWLDAQAVRKGA